MSISRGQDKEDVVHRYNGILLSHKNETVPFAETQMDLKSITQSEVSKKEKNKYHVLTHIFGIQENGTDETIFKAEIQTQMQRAK